MKIFFILFTLFPVSSLADTNWFRVSANASLIADWAQTLEIAKNDRFLENNNILGEAPSRIQVNKYFVTNILLTNAIGELLPKDYSNMFYLSVTFIEARAVLKNYTVGVRVVF